MNDSDLDGTLCWTPKCLGKKVWHGAKKAGKATGRFIGRNAGTIGTSIAIGGLVACTVATVGACGVVAAAGFAAASGTVAFMGAKYRGQSWGSSLAFGGISAGLNYIPFAKGIKPVRWFGNGRQYKSVVTALGGGRGVVNDRAVKRLGGQVWKSTANGVVNDRIEEEWFQ